MMFLYDYRKLRNTTYMKKLKITSGGRSAQREPPTMGKQLVSFITCSCELSAPFFVIYKTGRKLTPYW